MAEATGPRGTCEESGPLGESKEEEQANSHTPDPPHVIHSR